MMLKTITAFILQTFREAIRNKILYGIGFFAVAILLFSLVLGELSLNEQVRVIRDVGMTFIMIMAVALGIYAGVSMIHKEIDRRIIYTVLSKPIRRSEFIVGRFLGIALTLFVELLSMFVVFLGILVVRDIPIDAVLFQAFILVYVKSLIVAATALMFSTFSGAVLSSLMSLGIFIIGSLYDQFTYFAGRSDSPASRAVMYGAQFLLPNLAHLNLSTQVSYSLDVPWTHVAWSGASGLIYCVVLLCIACIVFEKRDFI